MRSRIVAATAVVLAVLPVLAVVVWPVVSEAGDDLSVFDNRTAQRAYRVEEHDLGDGWSVFVSETGERRYRV